MLGIEAAPAFQLAHGEAIGIVRNQVLVIRERWAAVYDEVGVSEVERQLFWRRQFLNPFVFEGAPPEIVALAG